MRIEDVLFFAPGIPFYSVDPSSTALISQFGARIEGYYLAPALKLADSDEAFPAGVLLASGVDALARYDPRCTSAATRYTDWLASEIPSFSDPQNAKRFYDDFRCGLIHEARIKNGCEFSSAFEETLHLEDGAMVVNPASFYSEVVAALARFSAYLRANDESFITFATRIQSDFQHDFAKNVRS
jgi:hypothetical protein